MIDRLNFKLRVQLVMVGKPVTYAASSITAAQAQTGEITVTLTKKAQVVYTSLLFHFLTNNILLLTYAVLQCFEQ